MDRREHYSSIHTKPSRRAIYRRSEFRPLIRTIYIMSNLNIGCLESIVPFFGINTLLEMSLVEVND
jgi:hypothetical protein